MTDKDEQTPQEYALAQMEERVVDRVEARVVARLVAALSGVPNTITTGESTSSVPWPNRAFTRQQNEEYKARAHAIVLQAVEDAGNVEKPKFKVIALGAGYRGGSYATFYAEHEGGAEPLCWCRDDVITLSSKGKERLQEVKQYLAALDAV